MILMIFFPFPSLNIFSFYSFLFHSFSSSFSSVLFSSPFRSFSFSFLLILFYSFVSSVSNILITSISFFFYQFTTLENVPPEFLITGSAARQAYSADTFPLGLSVLHLLTGEEPYEELLKNVLCPLYLKQQVHIRVFSLHSSFLFCSIFIIFSFFLCPFFQLSKKHFLNFFFEKTFFEKETHLCIFFFS